MEMDNPYITYQTLESLSSHNRQHSNMWKHHLIDVKENSMCVVDEIDDECFHTSDFEPFSDDDEFEMDGRLIDGDNHFCNYCTSDISSLDYSLFEPLKTTNKRCELQYNNRPNFCSGLIYMRRQSDDGKLK